MNTGSIIRRIFWMLYACPFTLLFLVAYPMELYQHGPSFFPYVALDLVISLPSLAALYLHIWDTKLLVPVFWKIYAFVLIAWDLLHNLLIDPALTGEKLGSDALFGAMIFLPLYFAVFRYGFRNWAAMKRSLSPADADDRN